MALAETLIFYVVVGTAVAVAAFLADEKAATGDRLFGGATAILFWPLYLPVLLRRPATSPHTADDASRQDDKPRDEMTAAIERVETELDAALRSLDGWGEEVLACEQERLTQLRTAWHAQAERIRELDRLLAEPRFLEAVPSPEPAGHGNETEPVPSQRTRNSEQARRENIERLQTIRRRMHEDLMGTLVWVRELVTMIHLAKFTGAPASRAEELVSQIAAAVEGLTEVSNWDRGAGAWPGSTEGSARNGQAGGSLRSTPAAPAEADHSAPVSC